MPDALPVEIPVTVVGILGTLVVGLLGLLGWMVKHVTAGVDQELKTRLKAVEDKVDDQALALKGEETERRLADQKLAGRIGGLGKEIRNIHDIVKDTQ